MTHEERHVILEEALKLISNNHDSTSEGLRRFIQHAEVLEGLLYHVDQDARYQFPIEVSMVHLFREIKIATMNHAAKLELERVKAGEIIQAPISNNYGGPGVRADTDGRYFFGVEDYDDWIWIECSQELYDAFVDEFRTTGDGQ